MGVKSVGGEQVEPLWGVCGRALKGKNGLCIPLCTPLCTWVCSHVDIATILY